ncbi:MAG: 2Fe-2S iron-sulfur cluster binding domain-containing protein [bacterium]
MINTILVTILVVATINGLLAIILIIAEYYFSNYGECTIDINQGKKKLTVTGGSTLLQTLNSQKIFLPSACGGRGTCGYCKCKIEEGGGPLLPTEEPMLTKDEIADNIRLSCQVKVKQDLLISIPEELFNIKEFTAEVSAISDLTYDIKLITLKLKEPKEIEFTPGQYIQLQSKPYENVKSSVSRAYSIASSSTSKESINLMIRLVPEGICTTWVHQYLKENDQVMFTGPMGDFRLHEGDGEMILVAGGSGMAPMVSLLAEIYEKKIQRKVTYFFGAKTKDDLFYIDKMEEFQKLLPDFTFVPVLSEPKPDSDWKGKTGLVTVPLEEYLQSIDTGSVQGYLCGSPGMINASVKVFKNQGVSGDRIFFDPFA